MGLENILVWVGIGICAIASGFALAALARPGDALDKPVSRLLLLGAVPLCAVLAMHGLEEARLPVFTRFDALTSYVLAMLLAYLALGRRRRLRGVSGFVAPYVTVIAALGLPFAGGGRVAAPHLHNAWLGAHVVTALFAYALFSLAGILAVAYLVQDHNLKRKRLGALFERLPALETLDLMMTRQVGFAFVLLTLSIILGFVMMHLRGGAVEWLADLKAMASLVTWGVYAVLVHLRASAGRHGRGVAMVTILGFCCVVFAFVGVHAIAGNVHRFLLISIPVP